MEKRESDRKERLRKMHEEKDSAVDEACQSGTRSIAPRSSSASNISIRSTVSTIKSSDLALQKEAHGNIIEKDSTLLKDRDQKPNSTKESTCTPRQEDKASRIALAYSATPNQQPEPQQRIEPGAPAVQQRSATCPPPPGATSSSGRGLGDSGRGRGSASQPVRNRQGPPHPSTMRNGVNGRGRGPPAASPGGRSRVQNSGRGRGGRGPSQSGRGPPPPHPVVRNKTNNAGTTAFVGSDPPVPKPSPPASPTLPQRSASPPPLREMIQMNSIRSMEKNNSSALEPEGLGELT